MKKIAIIVILLISKLVFSQNPFSQSTILETDFYNYKATDFGITTPKNVVEIEEVTYNNSMRLDGKMVFFDSITFKFKNGLLTYSNKKSKYLTYAYHFLYKNNTSKLLKTKNESKKYPEEVSFKYDNKGRLIEFDIFQQKFNKHTKEIFDYSLGKNKIENYEISDKGHKYDIKKFRLHSKTGKTLQKTKIATKYSPFDKNWYYEYDSNLNVKKISYNETLASVIQTGSQKSSEYTYNNKNLITSEIGNYSTSDFKLNYHYVFKYIYDKNNNWIAKFKFSTLYGYEDLFKDGFKEIHEVTLRKISYKDGTKTGNTNYNNIGIQGYLQKIANNNPIFTKKIPTDGFYWVKASDSEIIFYNNGKNIGNQLNFLLIIGNDFIVTDTINNITFNLKDFKNTKALKAFNKPIKIAKNEEVIWWKNAKNSFFSYQKGKQFIRKNVFSKNGLDLIFFNAEGEKEVVLEGYKNAILFQVKTAIPYKKYLKTHPNEEKKEIIPSGFVWKKDKNNRFWIFKNGVQDTSKIINDTFNSDLVLFNKTTKETYIFEDFYKKNPNTFYPINKLKGSTFWYKNEKEEIGLLHNFETYRYSKLQYAQNNTDVIIFNENNVKTFVIRNYKSSPANKLLPVINYENYKEKPTAAYLEAQEIKNCNDDKNCYVNLFNAKAESLIDKQHEEYAKKELANYMTAIYNQNPKMLFTVGLKTRAEYLDFYLAARAYLPKSVLNGLTAQGRSLINEYNKHMNSKETKDAIKKHGGTIIKN
jgi:hypothetical protein